VGYAQPGSPVFSRIRFIVVTFRKISIGVPLDSKGNFSILPPVIFPGQQILLATIGKTPCSSKELLWPPYGIGQAIIFSCCGFYLSSIYLSFFLTYSQRSEIGCLQYFNTCCGHSANLECRYETCCAWLAENTGCKKVAKNRHLGTIAQLHRAISSQLRHISTIGKKAC